MPRRRRDAREERLRAVLDAMGVRVIGKSDRSKANETRALGTLRTVLEEGGEERLTLTLRALVETHPDNAYAISAAPIGAVADIIAGRPDWVARGDDVFKAFDAVNLDAIERFAYQHLPFIPRRLAVAAIAMASLVPRMHPLPPARVPAEPKAPPRTGERFIEQGLILLARKQRGETVQDYGREVFRLESNDVGAAIRAAAMYGDRRDLVAFMSKDALDWLTRRDTSPTVRAQIEALLEDGERVTTKRIKAARAAEKAAHAPKAAAALTQQAQAKTNPRPPQAAGAAA